MVFPFLHWGLHSPVQKQQGLVTVALSTSNTMSCFCIAINLERTESVVRPYTPFWIVSPVTMDTLGRMCKLESEDMTSGMKFI